MIWKTYFSGPWIFGCKLLGWAQWAGPAGPADHGSCLHQFSPSLDRTRPRVL